MKSIEKTAEFQEWITGLTDKMVKARIAVRIDRLQQGNPGDVAPVGESVSELRLHFGSGWRIYFTERDGRIIVLLAGGMKSTQKHDIKLALELARNLWELTIMDKTITTPYDTAEYLKSEEDIALYFDACLEEAGNDAAFIAKALGTIARARGMTQLAKDTGLGREGLYKALSGDGNPSFDTILKVVHALGLRLHADRAPV
jgi:probable addiction module antidote protein/putative addiction module killer protein